MMSETSNSLRHKHLPPELTGRAGLASHIACSTGTLLRGQW